MRNMEKRKRYMGNYNRNYYCRRRKKEKEIRKLAARYFPIEIYRKLFLSGKQNKSVNPENNVFAEGVDYTPKDKNGKPLKMD